MARLKITHTCHRCGKSFHPWSKGKDGNKPRLWCSYECRKPPLVERFWSQVTKTNRCWTWTGDTDKDGYGRLWRNSKGGLERAHRLSWEIHYGAIPQGKQILHHCDNPPCVRPEHLYPGTLIDNVRDRTERGRERGELHGMAIVTEVQVREIRRRYATEKISQTALGNEYGLSQTGVSQIILKKCWKHIN